MRAADHDDRNHALNRKSKVLAADPPEKKGADAGNQSDNG